MFSPGLHCFKGSDYVSFLCERLCGTMSDWLTGSLHSLTHKCLSLYKAIQQDFFGQKAKTFSDFFLALVNGLLALSF